MFNAVKFVYATKQILQGDYTVSSLYHQIKLPLDIEISIPSDDPILAYTTGKLKVDGDADKTLEFSKLLKN